jgi:hypothetical protein
VRRTVPVVESRQKTVGCGRMSDVFFLTSLIGTGLARAR